MRFNLVNSVMGLAAAAVLSGCISGNKDIETSYGVLEGKEDAGVMSFLGVPYAQPPLGELRWQKPQAPQAWQGKRQALLSKSACVQAGSPTGAIGSSENCLYLNVWAPSSPGPHPVMMWLHGGGFLLGGANEPHYDGSKLAKEHNVVVVGVSYRLSYLGHVALPQAMTDELGVEPIQGNQVFYDQLAALNWIKSEISAFNGDADNITVFGESAGAMSTCMLLASPLTDGLLNKAIMQSGACSTFTPEHYSDTEAQGVELLSRLGCGEAANPLACAQALPSSQLKKVMKPEAMELFTKYPEEWTYNPKIVYGNDILPEHPLVLLNKLNKEVDVLIGSNKDEGTLFVFARDYPASAEGYMTTLEQNYGSQAQALFELYPFENYASIGDAMAEIAGDAAIGCSVQAAADILADSGVDVYRYVFKQPVSALTTSMFGLLKGENSVTEFGSFHAAEVPYIFGQASPLGSFPTQQHRDLAAQMASYWTQFARTGNPNHDAAFDWPVYDSQAANYLSLQPELMVESRWRQAQCAYWQGVLHTAPES